MKYAKLLLVGTALITMLSFSACRSSSSKPFQIAWHDVYGTACNGPAAGCNYYNDGYKIRDYQDPFYQTQYYLQYGSWTFPGLTGEPLVYTGWGWVSPSGILYEEYGQALNGQGMDDVSRDIIGDVAAAERASIERAARGLTERFNALSGESAQMIAKTLNDYATLGKKRHRTEADVADFTKRLYGISLSQAKSAIDRYNRGDLGAIEAANDDIAAHWGTTPETSKAVLKAWFERE